MAVLRNGAGKLGATGNIHNLAQSFEVQLVAAEGGCYSLAFFEPVSLSFECSLQMRPLLVIITAYLIGSIPFGYLIVRATQGADVRETGSGGTGATNVSRRAGKAAGVVTLVLDALKGAAAVAIAKLILGLPIFRTGSVMARSTNVGMRIARH